MGEQMTQFRFHSISNGTRRQQLRHLRRWASKQHHIRDEQKSQWLDSSLALDSRVPSKIHSQERATDVGSQLVLTLSTHNGRQWVSPLKTHQLDHSSGNEATSTGRLNHRIRTQNILFNLSLTLKQPTRELQVFSFFSFFPELQRGAKKQNPDQNRTRIASTFTAT